MIRCQPTGELYVGGTKTSFGERFGQHISQLRCGTHKASALQDAFNRFGAGRFEFIPLKVFSQDEVHDREREAIRRLQPALNPRPGFEPIIFRGREVDLTELARLTGLSRQMLHTRAARGLRGDDLVAPPHRTKRKQYTRQK